MAQNGYTPILIYSSSTAAAAPTAGSLTNNTLGSELAINITDGKLFYKDNANAIQVIGWKNVPISTLAGAGTGVLTALGVNVGTAGSFVVNGGALGTPSSGTVTNLTGTASININGTVGQTTPNTGAFTTLSATGVTTVQAGTVSVPAITTSGDTNTGIFFPAANTIAFANDGAEAMRLFSSTGVSIGNTTDPGAANLSVSGNVVIATSGKGIDFSATAGTGTSELLADYEEGTWTPVAQGSTSNGTATYTQQVGFYVKVGNIVHAQAYIAWSGHTGTGNLRISLPFTTKNTTSLYSGVSFGFVDNIALTAGNVLTAFTFANSSQAWVYQTPTGGGATTVVPMDAAGGLVYTASYAV